jgi:hypothetical protein
VLQALILALLAQAPAARQPQSASKKPDACALLADADVRTVLGVTVKSTSRGPTTSAGCYCRSAI